ncbi:REP-associated tyrosine transposase [Rhodanobacter sp. Col0626]|uniref:REP-associated tyrosine transposase n=1 Tax=Rhodanobacter sp. Col0626 TaxID=3415679 RepID=UPI003CFA7C72
MAALISLMQIDCMTYPHISGYRQLRNGRRSIPGQLYLLTTVTHRRQPHFLDPSLARTAARVLSTSTLWFPSRCLSWVLMPDHWHGLIELGEDVGLSTTVQRVKGVTAHIVKQQCAFEGPLWAKGFHDHALRRDESVEKVTGYIIANPVRARLVRDPMDYPYWDACFMGGGISAHAL